MISTRTPEGMPNRCPVCQNEIKIEPSRPTLDGPCPHCGHLLWFAEMAAASQKQLQIQMLSAVAESRFGRDDVIRSLLQSIAEDKRPERAFELILSCQNVKELKAALEAQIKSDV
jgi:hypothetical protein